MGGPKVTGIGVVAIALITLKGALMTEVYGEISTTSAGLLVGNSQQSKFSHGRCLQARDLAL